MTNADFSDGEAVQCLLDAWHETLAWRELEASLASTAPPPLPSQPKPRGLTVGRQVKTLVARAATNNSRDPAAYPFRSGIFFCLLALIACQAVPCSATYEAGKADRMQDRVASL